MELIQRSDQRTSKTFVTIIPLQGCNTHGGSTEEGMKHVYLHSHSCLPRAVLWRVTQRLPEFSVCSQCACSNTHITARKETT